VTQSGRVTIPTRRTSVLAADHQVPFSWERKGRLEVELRAPRRSKGLRHRSRVFVACYASEDSCATPAPPKASRPGRRTGSNGRTNLTILCPGGVGARHRGKRGPAHGFRSRRQTYSRRPQLVSSIGVTFGEQLAVQARGDALFRRAR